MTDNEIIKALECCKKTICVGCPNFHNDKGILWCKEELQSETLDLINRQKAEIERLKKENDVIRKEMTEN